MFPVLMSRPTLSRTTVTLTTLPQRPHLARHLAVSPTLLPSSCHSIWPITTATTRSSLLIPLSRLRWPIWCPVHEIRSLVKAETPSLWTNTSTEATPTLSSQANIQITSSSTSPICHHKKTETSLINVSVTPIKDLKIEPYTLKLWLASYDLLRSYTSIFYNSDSMKSPLSRRVYLSSKSSSFCEKRKPGDFVALTINLASKFRMIFE